MAARYSSAERLVEPLCAGAALSARVLVHQLRTACARELAVSQDGEVVPSGR
jgi:hypothetical protein